MQPGCRTDLCPQCWLAPGLRLLCSLPSILSPTWSDQSPASQTFYIVVTPRSAFLAWASLLSSRAQTQLSIPNRYLQASESTNVHGFCPLVSYIQPFSQGYWLYLKNISLLATTAIILFQAFVTSLSKYVSLLTSLCVSIPLSPFSVQQPKWLLVSLGFIFLCELFRRLYFRSWYMQHDL